MYSRCELGGGGVSGWNADGNSSIFSSLFTFLLTYNVDLGFTLKFYTFLRLFSRRDFIVRGGNLFEVFTVR